jgi:hypothetical protein
MIDHMSLRNLSPATQRSYIHAIKRFSRHFGRSPDRLGLEVPTTVSGGTPASTPQGRQ